MELCPSWDLIDTLKHSTYKMAKCQRTNKEYIFFMHFFCWFAMNFDEVFNISFWFSACIFYLCEKNLEKAAAGNFDLMGKQCFVRRIKLKSVFNLSNKMYQNLQEYAFLFNLCLSDNSWNYSLLLFYQESSSSTAFIECHVCI